MLPYRDVLEITSLFLLSDKSSNYQILDLPPVGPNCQVGVDALFHVKLKLRPVHPASQDVDVFLDYFHVWLKRNISTGRAFKHEPKVCKFSYSV